MKSSPTVTDDCDDIFGPPRTYANGYCPPKNRPSMISAKYRQKEERRKVLKISINKLKKIEDPEASLCRSVLINNTMKRLQKEARDEKIQKQQLNYPRCHDNDNFLNIKNEFMKNELKNTPSLEEPQDNLTSSDSKFMDSLKADFAMENEFDNKIAGDLNEISSPETAKGIDVLNGLVEENLNNLGIIAGNNGTVEQMDDAVQDVNNRYPKRSYDDVEDCDVQDVLSQFYMPPTPRMLTCIDDDEDVNVVDDEPLPKRLKTEETNSSVSSSQSLVIPPPLVSTSTLLPSSTSAFEPFESSRLSLSHHSSSCLEKKQQQEDFRVNGFLNNNITEADTRLRYMCPVQNLDTDANNAFSCGHASLFNELQSNVFHSLITSLET
ncbi:uncharacterized protein LOC108739150 isoform X2 [Agrilus planipennis]|nr:uncharacterized protein LOC108739150 isoform X2 [Agrilus planipennis]XP_018328398.1 uncharacterized protein LOC108739150 isoform X2 [Agrilus planipennis]XP_018328399.1 uncharacterized protein LOC108739150 isoform X2 [Agrilus planipennis]XP_018328400.1 uncharacterized protein LOC108739150 isoform X2 [Agrilus planipennis]XP_018328401.1 uncharacterized protein LOC108739150 isoform X2 [Agrilus planipennis]